MKPFVIRLDNFKQDILVLVGDEPREELKRAAKTLKLKFECISAWEREFEEVDGVLGRCLHSSGYIMLWLRKPPRDTRSISILAHEAMHASAAACGNIGMKFGDKSDEAYAYTLEYIVASVLENAGHK